MTEREFELMDDYLSNRLSAEDKAAFENQVQADPQLAQELNIQKDLVEGIKQALAVQLKSMLNNVPVSPINGGSNLLMKVGTWAVVAGLIATGVYFYSAKEEGTDEGLKNSLSEQQPEVKPEVAAVPEAEPETTDKKEESIQPAEQPEKRKKTVAAPAETTLPAPAKPLDVYDPSKDEADAETKRFENEQLENLKKAFVTSSIEVETDTMSKKYIFHYVFRDSKLVLYGAFEKNLYEILEFIGDEKRTVVLYYKANYYLLDIAKVQPTKLTPIRDRRLLKKLQEHRSK